MAARVEKINSSGLIWSPDDGLSSRGKYTARAYYGDGPEEGFPETNNIGKRGT